MTKNGYLRYHNQTILTSCQVTLPPESEQEEAERLFCIVCLDNNNLQHVLSKILLL